MYSKIEKLLEEKGITLYRLAKDCHIPLSTLYTWRRTNFKLNGKNIIIVSAYLVIRPEEML